MPFSRVVYVMSGYSPLNSATLNSTWRARSFETKRRELPRNAPSSLYAVSSFTPARDEFKAFPEHLASTLAFAAFNAGITKESIDYLTVLHVSELSDPQLRESISHMRLLWSDGCFVPGSTLPPALLPVSAIAHEPREETLYYSGLVSPEVAALASEYSASCGVRSLCSTAGAMMSALVGRALPLKYADVKIPVAVSGVMQLDFGELPDTCRKDDGLAESRRFAGWMCRDLASEEQLREHPVFVKARHIKDECEDLERIWAGCCEMALVRSTEDEEFCKEIRGIWQQQDTGSSRQEVIAELARLIGIEDSIQTYLDGVPARDIVA